MSDLVGNLQDRFPHDEAHIWREAFSFVFQLLTVWYLRDSQGSLSDVTHYDNIPMQYTAIFNGCKNGNFQIVIFFLFLHKTYCRYILKPPQPIEAVLSGSHNLCLRASIRK